MTKLERAPNPAWWRGFEPAEPGPAWSPPGELRLTGDVCEVDLAMSPLSDDMLRPVTFAHAEVHGVTLSLDEIQLLAYWSTFEGCEFRQRSRRLHQEGREPNGQLAWRPTLYRNCRFVGVRFQPNNGFAVTRARFEDCVFERCRWNVTLDQSDMIRCRVSGPMASVQFVGWSRGLDQQWRPNHYSDNDFTGALLNENTSWRRDFPVDRQRWPTGWTPVSEPRPEPVDPPTPPVIRQPSPGPAAPAPSRPDEPTPIRSPKPAATPRTRVPTRVGETRTRPSTLPSTRPHSLLMAVEAVPIPTGRASGYGSALCALGDGTVTTTWVAGVQAHRLARIDPLSGETMVVKGVRGDLRSVVPDTRGQLAWVLTTHALHEVELEPFRIRRTLGRPLSTYQQRAIRLDDDTLLVTANGRVAQLVSTSSMQVIDRIHVPAPELALPTSTGTTVYGFGARRARTLTDDHRPAGRARELPLGTHPIAVGGRIAFLPATPVARHRGTPPSDRVDGSTRAEPHGAVTFLDPQTLEVVATGPELGIGSLHGHDRADRLLVSDHGHDPKPGRALAVLGPEAQRVEGIVTLPGRLDAVAVLDAVGAVVLPHSVGTTPDRLWVVRWDQTV